EMNFLPDLFVPCPICHGKRFNDQTLEVRYRGQSVGDVLEMPIEAAAEVFEAHASIHRMLSALCDVGLGYLAMGQSSSILSGGEAQRIKLAADLGRGTSGRTLYVLDEPTTGLHFDDIRRLIGVLSQ